VTGKDKSNGGSQQWEFLRNIAAFIVGVYLLVRSQNPSTIVGFVSLVLMGFLPAGLLYRFFNGGK
jgi:hypothetical protein